MNKKYDKKIAEMLRDFPTCCKRFYKIKTTTKKIVPFKFRKAQWRIWRVIEKLIKENKPIRIIILKARQVGVSTLCEAFIYWLTTTYKNTNSIIIADEKLRASSLFEMSKLFLKYCDSKLKKFKPSVSTDNKKELKFDKLNSYMLIEMATKVKGGRTFTLNCVHASEVAFYPNADALFTSTIPSVPYLPMTCIIKESTSSGYGNYFHEEWKRAERGESNFIPIFIAWYDWEDYELKPTSYFRLTGDETKYKLKMKEKGVNLSKAQINWRRERVRELGKGGLIKFKREFPSTPGEAFISEKSMYFPVEELELIKPKEGIRGYLYVRQTQRGDVVEFRKDDNGLLEIWHFPERDKKGRPLNQYVMGCDTSSGGGLDDNVIDVVDKKEMRQCAQWIDNNAHSDQVAKQLDLIGKFYNYGLVAIEINRGEGIAAQDRLIEDYGYGNIYYREVYDGYREYTEKPGWVTSRRSRPIMLARFRECIRERYITIYSKRLLSELKSFLVIDNKPQGKPDDCIMATAIAIQLFDYLPDLDYFEKVPEPWREVLDEDSVTGYY